MHSNDPRVTTNHDVEHDHVTDDHGTEHRVTEHRVTARPGGSGRIVAIVNPMSGSAGDGTHLREVFPAEVVWRETTAEDPGTEAAADAVADGADTVVACGGDGTVQACLAPLAGSPTALGIVPLGTGNLLAGNLGVPDGDDAVRIATSGRIRRIDLGEVNGEMFAVMAGTGFDATMIRDASSTIKRRLGSVAYVIAAARNLPATVVPTTVEVDGSVVVRARSAMVLVGNCGAVTGGLEVFPDARPDDGRLDVAVLTADGVRAWASVLWRLVRGRPQRPALVRRFRGADIVVTTATPRPYELDGEDRPPTDRLEFCVRPGALSVRIPHPSDDHDA